MRGCLSFLSEACDIFLGWNSPEQVLANRRENKL